MKFDLVLLDHTLVKDDRLDLIQFIRDLGGTVRVLLLHKSGADCGADLHQDSREGPAALMSALKTVLTQSGPGTASRLADRQAAGD